MQTIKEAASDYVAAGLGVLPVGQDKAPLGPWKHLQQSRLDHKAICSLFDGANVAIICGAISGRLEVLDFDKEGIASEWYSRLRMVDERAANAVLNYGVWVSTPSGGDHIYYRCETPVDGNQKLAVAAETFKDKNGKEKTCLIETRGEGGYVVAPPSPGYCIAAGRFDTIPELPCNVVPVLHRVAKSFNEVEANKQDWGMVGQTRPGDAFNATASVRTSDLLTRYGWSLAFEKDGTKYMRRPGKDSGVSATCDSHGGGAYIFSTNAEPLAEGSHTKFDVFATLEHGGDHQAAARALGLMGYGDPPKRPSGPLQRAQAPQLTPRVTLASKIVSGGPNGLLGRARERDYLFYTGLFESWRGVTEPHGVLPCGRVGMLVGEGGAGKTWWTMQLAVSVASKLSFLGYSVRGSGRVLLLSAEMNSEDMDDRLRHVLNANGVQSLADREAVLSRIARVPLQGVDVAMVDRHGAQTNIVEQIAGITRMDDYALVVIDPLAQFGGPGVETDPVIGNEIVRLLSGIASGRGNPAVLLVHHTAKGSRGGIKTTSAAARGTSALTDGVRWQGNLETRERLPNHPDFAVFRQTKSNDGPAIPSLPLVRDESHGGLLRKATRDEWAAYREAAREAKQ